MNFRGPTPCLIKLLAFFAMLIHHVSGHGRLMEPPARNAMWRFGYPNAVNYNDNGKLYLPGLIFHSFNKLLLHRAFLRRLCG
jgi:hypothetical protein